MTTLLATADQDVLARKIEEFVKAGRLAPARSLLEVLRRREGSEGGARVACLAARLAAREGRWNDAAAELDAVLARHPELNEARKQRADLRLRTEDLSGAALDAADAVIQDPADPEAKAILGTILIECGRPADAVTCLTEAVAGMPGHSAPWLALARAHDALGDPQQGIATLQQALCHGLRGADVLNMLLLAFIRNNRPVEAIELARRAQAGGTLDATGFGLLGHALSSMDQHEQAFDAYCEALKLAPEDPYVAHLAAASGRIAGKDRAPEDYLEVVFDGYADRFECHLISLGYRVPGLMRQALTELGPLPAGPVLDLGCGTGLVGVAVGDLLPGPLTGIDLSRRMLGLAAEKTLYAHLEQGDAVRFLAETAGPWSMILAADVLCYFGALEELLTLVGRRLSPGGLFLFSAEALQEDEPRGWRLGRQARFSHAEAYLRDTLRLAGLRPALFRAEAQRMEAGRPVAGFLVGAVHAEAGHA